jgi:phosphoglycerol transferase MdoB-like AlkP superfamily enzyme
MTVIQNYIFERSFGRTTFVILFPMKQVFRSVLMQFLFWILFFDLSRIVFLLYYAGLVRAGGASFPDLAGVFFWSFQLDFAVACYLLFFPVLLLSVQLFVRIPWLNTVNRIYTGVMVLAYSLTVAGELGIYGEWKSKLSYKALKYLAHPSEVYNSATTGTFLLLLVLLAGLIAAGVVAYLKWFSLEIRETAKNRWISAGLVLIAPLLLFIGARGGLQPIPINQSKSYFSKHEVLNHAAVNNAFNLMVSITENYRLMEKNPYIFMDRKRAEQIVRNIYRTPEDTTLNILAARRPNIVLLILESFSGDLIESLGGKPGITPEFAKLEKEGLLFTQVYSAGMRSEQGMASIFGGFPAHPMSCSVTQPQKYHALPSMPLMLKDSGYHTSFYFGGQLIYGNIKGYIYYNGFERIVEGADMPDSLPRGKLGIHDGYMLNYLESELGRNQQPFFTALFTISSHSPYDQPFEKPLTWGGSENNYINSAFYTDHCLGRFFTRVKNTPWYANTLFILVADHSHNSYYNWSPSQKEYRHIPLLMLGGALKPEFRGTVCEKLGNQQDLAATLLTQLGMSSAGFRWSKNLLNPYVPDFAWFANENGYGWVRPGMEVSRDIDKNWMYIYNFLPNMKDSIRREGEAYLQVVFQSYIDQ